MKIVFVSYHYWPPHFGGELKISIERFESLVKRGHAVTVLTSGVPGFPSEEMIRGVQIKRSPLIHDSRIGRGFRRLLFPLWASAQMRRMSFEILHHGGVGGVNSLSNRFGMEILNNTAQKRGASSVWVHCLADSEEIAFGEIGFGGKMRNRALRSVDAIVSVSPALHEGVSNYFPEKAGLILNGVRDDVFIPLPKNERDTFRREHDVTDDQVVFSFLGTISKRKGFDLLSSAFISLLNDNPSLRLWIIGPKNKTENQNVDEVAVQGLTSAIKAYPGAIKFWGRIDDRKELAKIMASSDIFVFPSRKEGMPLAPMEAMACGLPVIISRIPGVTDRVNVEGVTGRYAEVNDEEGLRNAMFELAADPRLREKMGIAARKRIIDEFNWEKHIDDWEALYTSLKRD